MQEVITDVPSEGAVTQRTATLFQEYKDDIHKRADHLFAKLMVAQWLAGIAAALWISPKTWIGTSSQVHWHVWAAIFIGGAISSLPVFLAWKQPGRSLTRHTIAVAQMLTSALLIHLTGGRIETHFHVFGSLAFLAFYRDWRVLLTATAVVAADHMARGLFWPQSVFGVLSASPWRWLEHAAWVLFEDTFLVISIGQSLKEMFEVATRRAKLEGINAEIERQVAERTAELTAAHKNLQSSEHRLRSILESEPECVKLVAADGTLLEMNPAGLNIVEADHPEQVIGRSVYVMVAPEYHSLLQALNAAVFQGESRSAEFESIGLKGTRRSMETRACPLRDTEGKIFAQLAVTRDITQRKQAGAELEKVHKELLKASRQAGMAEVATGVLHNVGNVLNSVNISSSLLANNLRKSKIANLSKVAALVSEHETDLSAFVANDPRGKQLPGYLTALAEHLGGEQAAALEELALLQKNIEHIKDIVAMQQNYATVAGVAETLNVSELIEDALRMNSSALARHDIQIVKEFGEPAPILVEKHKLLQILVNLVRNAKHACQDSGRQEKRLTIRVSNGDGRIRIVVKDNGVGIPRENLTRIFAHGFTTKRNGHGFGLHSGALAAKEMGGSLSVHSDGPGKGAVFTLELPVKQESSAKLYAA
jgi:PAS domain S-box-containing protein